MEFSLRFISDVTSIFHTVEIQSAYSSRRLSLENNDVFKKNLVIEIDKDEIEIPVIARDHFEEIVSNNWGNRAITGLKKIILPLYSNSQDIVRKTFDSIIRQAFNVNYDCRLQKITTGRGEVCYGGKGIILDKDYTPLVLCTLLAKKVHGEKGDIMTYYRPICHINPKVFIETDKLVHKGIIKKLIPCYTSREMVFPRSRYFNRGSDKKVKVIIDNFDKFFATPVKPTPSANINDDLNNCLIDNIEEILMKI